MKNQNLLTVGVIIAIVLSAIALWVATKAPQINLTDIKAAATSPGTGGGITANTDITLACIMELYDGAVNVPKVGVKKAQVDDAIAECVKARGSQRTTGGQCDPNVADNCSNSFAAAGQDPDSDYVMTSLNYVDRVNKSIVGKMDILSDRRTIASASQTPGLTDCHKEAAAFVLNHLYQRGCQLGAAMVSAQLNCVGMSISINFCQDFDN